MCEGDAREMCEGDARRMFSLLSSLRMGVEVTKLLPEVPAPSASE